MADVMVLKTQQWLNATYGGMTGYGSNIVEDGYTGINTINALLRAFQIELGITNTANTFGPTTVALFNTRFPNGIQQQAPNDPYEDNIYGIIQGACWCKGYTVGASNITRHFYGGTGNAIKNLRSDAGIDATTSTISLNIMKALLSMKYFRCEDEEIPKKIQTAQKYLNNHYENYIGLIPCDGKYSRDMNKALIFAIQAEEGLSPSTANGNFGQTTKACCPTIPYNNVETNVNGLTYSSSSIDKFIIIMKIALYVNGFGSGEISNIYDSTIIGQFQTNLMLNSTGICNLSTWLALLTSCGDVTRSAVACDTIYEMTSSRLSLLASNGFSIVGRYLTNTPNGSLDKKIKPGELSRIFNANFKFFPIFQESASYVSYFTAEKGTADLKKAFDAALIARLPQNTVIYFAVDFDATDANITNNILPYFQALHSAASTYCMPNYYKIGIYGTRNVCQRVLTAGYAVTSFVSDMSSGYSGNMGFGMPSNWTFDQFYETTISTNNESLNIDKVAYNENSSFDAVTQLDNNYPSIPDGIDDYHLGTATDIGEEDHFGNYFTVRSNHMRLTITLTSIIDTNPNLVADIMVFQSGVSYPIFSAYSLQRDVEIPLDWISLTKNLDYRIKYSCSHNGSGSEPTDVSGNIDVHISTNYSE
ncbi:MAG: DUF1906 domain-containing protein [Clostridia bacterium]|nr:DUF1906 domain-containing protein [Clostridia bacterium]